MTPISQVVAVTVVSDFTYRAVASAMTPLAAGMSGLAFAGAFAGVVSALVAIAALYLSVRFNARQERRTIDREIQEAFDRGRASMQNEIVNLRDDLAQARRKAERFESLYFTGRPPEMPPTTRDPA